MLSNESFKSLRQIALELKNSRPVKDNKIVDDENFYIEVCKKFNDIMETLDVDGEKIKKDGGYRFNPNDEKFIKDILNEYTDESFKLMRKASFSEVDPRYIENIIVGFSRILKANISDEEEANNEIIKMYSRTDLPILKETFKVKKEIEKFTVFIEEFSVYKMLKKTTINDKYLLLGEIKSEIQQMVQKWKNIYMNIEDIRNLEFQEFVDMEYNRIVNDPVLVQKDLEQINIDISIYDALKSNQVYNSLLKERDEILRSDGFIKNKKKIMIN